MKGNPPMAAATCPAFARRSRSTIFLPSASVVRLFALGLHSSMILTEPPSLLVDVTGGVSFGICLLQTPHARTWEVHPPLGNNALPFASPRRRVSGKVLPLSIDWCIPRGNNVSVCSMRVSYNEPLPSRRANVHRSQRSWYAPVQRGGGGFATNDGCTDRAIKRGVCRVVSYLVRRRPLPVASGAATVAMTADIMTAFFLPLQRPDIVPSGLCSWPGACHPLLPRSGYSCKILLTNTSSINASSPGASVYLGGRANQRPRGTGGTRIMLRRVDGWDGRVGGKMPVVS